MSERIKNIFGGILFVFIWLFLMVPYIFANQVIFRGEAYTAKKKDRRIAFGVLVFALIAAILLFVNYQLSVVCTKFDAQAEKCVRVDWR